MTAGDGLPGIVDLDKMVRALPAVSQQLFQRIFDLRVTEGMADPPPPMREWIEEQFGSVDAVRRQNIVRITNRITQEGSLFNGLRTQRPLEAPVAPDDVEEAVSGSLGGPFCRPLEGTPADVFGRLRGRSSVTASNVAKYDGWHAVIIFDEHHPLQFTAEQVVDYVDTALAWAREVHRADAGAIYPLVLWNCLWRSGASILHGHAQAVVTGGSHYAKVEAYRRAAASYCALHGTRYFDDLARVHRDLGLAIDYGEAIILPSLTPFKEKETHIIASRLSQDLKLALYAVLRAFIDRLGTRSFNAVLYLPPLAPTPEDWDGFPVIVRVLDRGDLQSRTSDVGAMEIFAESVVSTDPFWVAAALRELASPVTPGSSIERGPTA